MYVEIVGADGSVEQKLIDPDDPEQNPFIIGTPDNGELWNEEGPGFGGTAIPGGSEVFVQTTYMRYSMWTVDMYMLEEVPEALTNEFESFEQLQDAMDAETEGAVSWEEDKFQADYYEVSLLKATDNGQEPVSNEEFPVNGIWVMFAYPEGTDKDTDFVITHMFTEDSKDGKHKAGDIETIKEGDRLIKTDRGVKVLMYSLSPISVAYGEADDTNSDNQGGSDNPAGGTTGGQPSTGGNGTSTGGNAAGSTDSTTAGGSAATDKADTATKTGDDFNMALPIALAGLAVIGMAAAVVTRKKFN